MNNLSPGTTVYFCWYDFQHKKEHTLTGEVVDNSDYQDTQWADFVYVRFQPSGMSAPIHHHFLPDCLSTDNTNVPHDYCYTMENITVHVPSYKVTKDNPWLQMTEFKNKHWDGEHNRLQVDALDEFYRLWHIAINWRIGQIRCIEDLPKMKIEYPNTPKEAKQPQKQEPQPPQPMKKQEVVQLDLFD